jgi:trehalose utilization protein
MSLRITIWNEYRHEKANPKVAEIYPRGMHAAIAEALNSREGLQAVTATLDEAEHGLSEERLRQTDVLTWWGHLHHDEVSDALVDRVQQRVLAGMGLVVLHSGHFSKIFKRLMGTTCDLKWREGDDREILWVTRPGHPIIRGVGDHFILPREEMYGEFFDIPEPQETILISHFTGGEVFRSLCTWTRGAGKIVYFRPGHETLPTYHDATVQRIIENACRWAAPAKESHPHDFGHRPTGWLDSPQT